MFLRGRINVRCRFTIIRYSDFLRVRRTRRITDAGRRGTRAASTKYRDWRAVLDQDNCELLVLRGAGERPHAYPRPAALTVFH